MRSGQNGQHPETGSRLLFDGLSKLQQQVSQKVTPGKQIGLRDRFSNEMLLPEVHRGIVSLACIRSALCRFS
jgi:hypothetical protein